MLSELTPAIAFGRGQAKIVEGRISTRAFEFINRPFPDNRGVFEPVKTYPRSRRPGVKSESCLFSNVKLLKRARNT